MPKTEDWFEPRFGRRLRAELDRVQPLGSGPRYAGERPVGVWRIAPLGLTVAVIGIVAMAAWAATGSANPTVWTQKVETVIAPPSPSPTSEPAPAQPQPPQAAAPPAPAPRSTPRPTQRPDGGDRQRQSPWPSPSPRPSGSPEPDDHSGWSWSGARTSPPASPSPSDR